MAVIEIMVLLDIGGMSLSKIGVFSRDKCQHVLVFETVVADFLGHLL
jgi:hypothetical membrane protein